MVILQQFTANDCGRDFVIGDLHGHLDCLYGRLEEVSFDYQYDRLFSVGDLIDRGPASAECLALAEEDWFHAVCGNHEGMLKEVASTRQRQSWYNWVNNGGEWFANVDKATRQRLIKIAVDLPLAIEVELQGGRRVGITHAAVPCKDWRDLKKVLVDPTVQTDFLWSRKLQYARNLSPVRGIDLTVHGHNYEPIPCLQNNSALIDQGAGYLDPGERRRESPNPKQLSIFRLEELFELPDRFHLLTNFAA